jgi:hypothetical protein
MRDSHETSRIILTIQAAKKNLKLLYAKLVRQHAIQKEVADPTFATKSLLAKSTSVANVLRQFQKAEEAIITDHPNPAFNEADMREKMARLRFLQEMISAVENITKNIELTNLRVAEEQERIAKANDLIAKQKTEESF